MIPVAIKGFNELDALQTTISYLIVNGVDRIVFFDGPFEDFAPELPPISTDGTLEYLKQFSEVEIVPCGRMSLMDKETRLFQYFTKEQCVLILDCDEVLKGDWFTFNQIYNLIKVKYPQLFYSIAFTDMDMHYTTRTNAVRLFLDPGNWSVSGQHWHYKYKGERVNLEKPRILGGVHLFHDSSLRPKYREEQMNKFQQVYQPKEDELYYKENGIESNKDDNVMCEECGCTHGIIFYTHKPNDPSATGTRMARYIDIRCEKHKKTYRIPNL